MSFELLFEFESALADYTGAPYVVVTDGCTHAVELCMRYDQVKSCKFTAFTYLSIPMCMQRLGINYSLVSENWIGEYQFYGTRIWDSARRLEPGMYQPGQMQCLSFGWSKPLQLGRVGAVLLDDEQAYRDMSLWRSDGRDLHVTPWNLQEEFGLGFHYCPTLELCEKGSALLPTIKPACQQVEYPDCRNIIIQS
jgi:hypothetical protein